MSLFSGLNSIDVEANLKRIQILQHQSLRRQRLVLSSCYCLVVNDYRRSYFQNIVQLAGFAWRQIYAAVTA